MVITTIDDARFLVTDGTQRYLEPLTDDQVEKIARGIVDIVGYGGDTDDHDDEIFEMWQRVEKQN
jgi:hypothetical protein